MLLYSRKLYNRTHKNILGPQVQDFVVSYVNDWIVSFHGPDPLLQPLSIIFNNYKKRGRQ